MVLFSILPDQPSLKKADLVTYLDSFAILIHFDVKPMILLIVKLSLSDHSFGIADMAVQVDHGDQTSAISSVDVGITSILITFLLTLSIKAYHTCQAM